MILHAPSSPAGPICTGPAWGLLRAGAAAAAAAGLALVLAPAAQAHHLIELQGLQPNAINGLVSGLAHPVIGPDHLVFLLALSLLGMRQRLGWSLALLAIGLAGSVAGLLWPGLPAMNVLLAGTIGLEAAVLIGWLPRFLVAPAMALHGYVLSEAVLGWTAMPIGFYLLGLLISQALLLLAALQLFKPTVSRLALRGRRGIALGLFGLSLAFGLMASQG